jgi:CHAD domain-containing protein
MSPLHNYINHLFHDAKKYAGKAAKDFDEEDIHKMRVEVKKIKAAFHFLQFVDADLKDDELKKLKKIFREAGELRELQLLTEAIRKFRGLQHKDDKKSLLDFLKEEEKKSKKKFHREFQKSGNETLDKLKKVMFRKREITDDDEVRYFQNMLAIILELMGRDSLADEEYHEVRKKLKELKYNLSFASDRSKQIVEDVFSEKELTELEEVLGTWHDQVIIISRLKKIAEEKESLRLFIEEAISRTQRRSRLLLKKISSRFQKKTLAMQKLGNNF